VFHFALFLKTVATLLVELVEHKSAPAEIYIFPNSTNYKTIVRKTCGGYTKKRVDETFLHFELRALPQVSL
jgi:hypothetical protein